MIIITLLIIILILIINEYVIAINDCEFDNNVSKHIQSILCAVESGKWYIPINSTALINSGCLLGSLTSGGTRCDIKLKIPSENELKRSPLPPPAKNKQYQKLAMKAEELVPKTFWREAFADTSLLLTKNDRELPRKQLDNSRMKNRLFFIIILLFFIYDTLYTNIIEKFIIDLHKRNDDSILLYITDYINVFN
jgi:hypothetical protein